MKLLSLMEFVTDHFKRKERYNEAVRNNPWLLAYVPDNLKTRGICEKAVNIEPWLLAYVPNNNNINNNNNSFIHTERGFTNSYII